MKFKDFMKKAAGVVAFVFSGIGAVVSFLFFFRRDRKETTFESVESVKKKRREEIEKTDADILVADSAFAGVHESRKEELKQELDSRVDGIVSDFLQGGSSGAGGKDKD